MGLDSFDQSEDGRSSNTENKTTSEDQKYKQKPWLKEQIQVKGLSQNDVADIAGVSKSTIQYYKEKFDINTHKDNQKNKSVSLSQEHIDIIEGELLGDASLHRVDSCGNAKLQSTDKHTEYIEWLRSLLPDDMFTDQYVFDVNNGANMLVSRNTVELDSLLDKWYEDEKSVPSSFSLNSTNLLHWYMCDGTLSTEEHPILDMRWTGRGEAKLLSDMIEHLGIDVNLNEFERESGKYWRIYVKAGSVTDFFEVIGDCPIQCYSYKWV